MHTQKKDRRDANKISAADSLPRSQNNHGQQHGSFVDNRPLSPAYQLLSSIAQQPATVAQRMLVAQLATRTSRPFQFGGSIDTLENLILQWGPPRGTRVVVSATDFVGGTYTAKFTNNGGPRISKDQADDWVRRGIAHFQEDSSESETE